MAKLKVLVMGAVVSLMTSQSAVLAQEESKTQINVEQGTTDASKKATAEAIAEVDAALMKAIETREKGRESETYNAMAAWYGDDGISQAIKGGVELLKRWYSEFCPSQPKEETGADRQS